MRSCKCEQCGDRFTEDDSNPNVHYSTPAKICMHCESGNRQKPVMENFHCLPDGVRACKRCRCPQSKEFMDSDGICENCQDKMKNKSIILVDIDGTIAQATEERLACIAVEKEGSKDWRKFLDMCVTDLPKTEILNLVRMLAREYEVVFCTGRNERYRKDTLDWLKKHFLPTAENFRMLMRTEGDHRPDTEIKPELLKKAGIELDHIEFVLEDRKTVTKMWRDMGLTCLQVVEGDY